MDYEKKYNEALKDVRAIYPNLKGDAKLAVEHAFPELRESEDERIRNEIIDHLVKEVGLYPGEDRKEHRWLRWLEKQKEQKSIIESKRLANEVIEYLTRCGYSPVLKDDSKKEHFHIDIPRHEDDFWHSEEYKHCRSVLGEYYMEGDYGGDTYTLYIWKEKKEQKPNYCHHEVDETGWSDEYRKAYYDGWNNCNIQHELLNSQNKPSEWSEEDERIIDTIVSVLGQYIDYKAVSGTGSGYATPRYANEISWLKSLRPSWKPSKVCYGAKGDPDPAGVWKPSEEQMKHLQRAINCYESDWGENKLLRSLIYDLKKLM